MRFRSVFILASAEFVVLFGGRLVFEYWTGNTVGKWLLGLRTVRSTLRPCGFAQLLVRDVLYFVDVPFALTPLPAAVSMMLSPLMQRLGDQAADTIVIRDESIKEFDISAVATLDRTTNK